jgi:hypothetical protein
LIFDVYAPLSIAAVVSVSLVGLSWAMEPSELSPSWNRSSESSSTAAAVRDVAAWRVDEARPPHDRRLLWTKLQMMWWPLGTA